MAQEQCLAGKSRIVAEHLPRERFFGPASVPIQKARVAKREISIAGQVISRVLNLRIN